MQGTLKIAKPTQARDGTWIIRGTLDGKPVRFDTSLTPLGPWCVTTNGQSAKSILAGGGKVTEVYPGLAMELWERARDLERKHIRKALIAAEHAGFDEDRLTRMRAMLNANNGRAREWDIVQVVGRRMVKTSEHPKGIIKPVTRRVRCGSSLIVALVAYRKLIEQNRHTFIRKAA